MPVTFLPVTFLSSRDNFQKSARDKKNKMPVTILKMRCHGHFLMTREEKTAHDIGEP